MSDWRRMAQTVYPFRTQTGLDHMAWAKRIIEREKHNDPELSSIQVAFAKQALGLIPLPQNNT